MLPESAKFARIGQICRKRPINVIGNKIISFSGALSKFWRNFLGPSQMETLMTLYFDCSKSDIVAFSVSLTSFQLICRMDLAPVLAALLLPLALDFGTRCYTWHLGILCYDATHTESLLTSLLVSLLNRDISVTENPSPSSLYSRPFLVTTVPYS